jgi:hypothetical protein
LDELIDYSLRTYLLVHQVSIKLVLYYREAFEVLYTSVMKWIQNPFSPEVNEEWSSIEDLFIAASLVGISWATLREPFVRKLFAVMIKAAGLRENATPKQWADHLFHQNKQLIYRILYEFSFFFTSSNRNIAEQDRAYSRCAGSIPKSQRDAMKAMVMDVEKLSTIQEFWLTMGMDDASTSEDDIIAHIKTYTDTIITKSNEWAAQTLDTSSIVVPPSGFLPFTRPDAPPSYSATPSSATPSSATPASPSSSSSSHTHSTSSYSPYKSKPAPAAPLVLKQDLDKKKKEEEDAERLKHLGYPELNPAHSLDSYKCNYKDCGRVFPNRDALFRHLNRMIPKDRMIRGYHKNHFSLKVTDKDALQCGSCKEKFASKDLIYKHYTEKGVPGDWSNPSAATTASAPPAAAADTTCIVCMEKPRDVVNVPCGHCCMYRTCCSNEERMPYLPCEN